MAGFLGDALFVLATVAVAAVCLAPFIAVEALRRANTTWRWTQEVGRETPGLSPSTSNPRRPIDTKETTR